MTDWKEDLEQESGTGVLALAGGGREAEGEGWNIAWSDLMMTMFIFFAVLFATSAIEKEVDRERKLGPVAETLPIDHERLPSPRMMASPGLGAGADVAVAGFWQIEASRSVVASVHFIEGSDALDERSLEALRGLSRSLRTVPWAVEVVGHAFGEGSAADEWDLSLGRAGAAARFLVDSCGLDPSRVTVSGRGGESPLVPGSSKLSTARNRRVDVTLVRGPETAGVQP
ncbi:MAG: hypothetical protein EOM25_08095 [Deltaproteobacteria bacterium]|nr:hypothetical protein [Deltaproteobacteria bacterium]